MRIDVDDLGEHFRRTVAAAEAGDDMMITRQGQPILRMIRATDSEGFAAYEPSHLVVDLDDLP